jgi:hypothetical protein
MGFQAEADTHKSTGRYFLILNQVGDKRDACPRRQQLAWNSVRNSAIFFREMALLSGRWKLTGS